MGFCANAANFLVAATLVPSCRKCHGKVPFRIYHDARTIWPCLPPRLRCSAGLAFSTWRDGLLGTCDSTTLARLSSLTQDCFMPAGDVFSRKVSSTTREYDMNHGQTRDSTLAIRVTAPTSMSETRLAAEDGGTFPRYQSYRCHDLPTISPSVITPANPRQPCVTLTHFSLPSDHQSQITEHGIGNITSYSLLSSSPFPPL